MYEEVLNMYGNCFFSFSKKLRKGRCWAVSVEDDLFRFCFVILISRKLKINKLVFVELLN